MSKTTPLKNQIEEILHSLSDDIADAFGGDIDVHSQKEFENIATSQILKLISDEVVKARISELERVIRGYHMVNHLMDESELRERIKELENK